MDRDHESVIEISPGETGRVHLNLRRQFERIAIVPDRSQTLGLPPNCRRFESAQLIGVDGAPQPMRLSKASI